MQQKNILIGKFKFIEIWKMKRKTKVCLISSCGGHFMELLQLLPVVDGKDYYILTEKNVASIDALAKHRHCYFFQQNRHSLKFPFFFFINFLLSIVYFFREKPTTVITTGAGVVFPTCILAYLFKRRLIYIESFSRIHKKSCTGKFIYLIADSFFVQWPEMLEVYHDSKYSGTVY